MEVLGNLVIGAGVVFILFGVIGVFRFQDFFTKFLVAAKIETVGVITILAGIAIQHGLSFFTARIILIIAIVLILNPVVSHVIIRAAYLSRGEDEAC